METKATVYQTYQLDRRYNSPLETGLLCHDTEAEAIKYLETNGGGVYRNLLCNLKMEVKGVSNPQYEIHIMREPLKEWWND